MTHKVMPISTADERAIRDQRGAMGLPCVIGRAGILRILEPALSESEVTALRQSARKFRELIGAAVSVS